ncbi:MAG: hypothetical protein WKF78_08925 [Candidatus Limnocylindrales bacterium]
MPAARQLSQDGEQAARLTLVEGGIRLIEDEHARSFDEQPAQLHQLALADAQCPDRDVRVRVQADPFQDGRRATAHGRHVDESEAGGLPVREQVGQQGAIREQAQFLVDDAHASGACIGRRGHLRELTRDADFARVGPDGPGQDLHQGGLAGSVLADDGVHGAGRHGEIHTRKGLDPAVGLAQTGDRDGGCHRGQRSGLHRTTWTRSRWAPPWSSSSR